MRYQLLAKSEFLSMMKKEHCMVIDLRDRLMYETWHMPGAVNRSYDTIREWSRTLDHRKKILLYCSHGNESILAARYLGSNGFQVYSLIGGIGNRR